MSRFAGARELGLRVEWRLSFVPFGVTASPLPGVLYLDVGGSVVPGVIDHHQGELEEESASEIALRQPECSYGHLMTPWLRRADEGTITPGTLWRPTLVTHFSPDWDAVVASWIVKRLVEDGDFPPEAAALVTYSSDIDQGRHRLDPGVRRHLFAPHLGYLALQNLKREGRGLSSEEQVQRGWELIERVVRDVRAATDPKRPLRSDDFLPPHPGATRWADDPGYGELRLLLEQDEERFARDWASGEQREVELPSGDTQVEVQAFVLREPPQSALHKYWVRQKCPLYICPYGEAEGGVYPRVVLSLDPGHTKANRRPNLQGLGYRLEQEESAIRRTTLGRDDRRGRPRFPDGYCDNDDPWYDGRAHGWTIVDSPRSGTRIPFDTIVGIATGGDFWQIPVDEARLTLAWVGGSEPCSPDAKAPPHFDEMADGLRPFYADLHEEPLTPSKAAGFEGSVTEHRRTLGGVVVPGHSPTLRLHRLRVTTTADRTATLQKLVAYVKALRTPPDYSFVRIRVANHFSPVALEESLLARLAGGTLTTLAAAGDAGAEAFFHSHGLLLRHHEALPPPALPDAAEEILLYVALAHGGITRFSERIADLVPAGAQRIRSLDSEALNTLRTDFIRFQSRDFTLNVSRVARVQEAFNHVVDAIGLRAHYHEVQSGLDRLAELESQFAEDRLSRADTIAQAILFAIAVAGLLQSVVAVDTWPHPARWPITGGVLLLGLAAWGLVERVKRKR